MIKFDNPYIIEMNSGNLCLTLTDEGSWETFPLFAEKLTKKLDATVIEKIDGPDIRIWEIEINSIPLRLVYEDYPNGVSIESKDENGHTVILDLLSLLSSSGNKTYNPLINRTE